MADYFDIHTHHMGGDGFRIVNRPPDDFMPCQEQWYSVGVHPWALQQGEVRQETWEKLREAAVHPQVLAVGEAGLDRLVQVPMKLQEAVFARQAELAGEAGKPLIVHLVRAVDELLRLKKALKPGVPWIILLHPFSVFMPVQPPCGSFLWKSWPRRYVTMYTVCSGADRPIG